MHRNTKLVLSKWLKLREEYNKEEKPMWKICEELGYANEGVGYYILKRLKALGI